MVHKNIDVFILQFVLDDLNKFVVDVEACILASWLMLFPVMCEEH